MGDARQLSPRASILVGLAVAAAGVAIIAIALFAGPEGFHAPRWVVACAGGAFVFFGGWTAAIYARGFDPLRPQETLPSPRIQLLAFLPGMLLFAAPFHWVAFGAGPRQFSTGFSLPFLSVGHSSGGGLSGRIFFGLGAAMIDAILVVTIVRLLRAGGRRAGATDSPPGKPLG